MINAIKIIENCPECWMGTIDSCTRCHGTGEIEDEMDFTTFVEYVGGELCRHYHMHEKEL